LGINFEHGHVGRLNQQVKQGKEGEIIKISEALHEKKIAEMPRSWPTESHR
jgi:hypothetical protein